MRQRQDGRGRYRARAVALRDHVTAVAKTQTIQWADPEVGNQEAIFHYGPAPVCASGGFGAAKTYAFCIKILFLCQTFPGYRVMIGRRVWEELRKTTMATFFKVCPPSAYRFGKRADTEKVLELNPVLCDDGIERQSTIHWMHLESAETESVVRGYEMNAFFVDQAEELDEELFDLLDSRLGRWDGAHVPQAVIEAYRRDTGEDWPWWNSSSGKPEEGSKAIPPSYAMLSVNPDTFLHWIYRRFHQDSPDHDLKFIPDPETGELRSYKDLGYRMFHMDSRHNRFLPKQTLAKLLAKGKDFVTRFVAGIWGIPEGQIHHISEASLIAWEPGLVEKVIRRSLLHRILDHGETAPTACAWAAVDTDGNSVFYREYYEPGKLIREHRKNITLLSGRSRTTPTGEGEYESDLADPSMFDKVSQVKGGKFSLADEYKDTEPPYTEEDAIYWHRADNNELVTRDRINDYLRVDPEHRNPFTGVMGAPRFYFIKKSAAYPHGCDRMIRETQSQRRVKIGTVNGVPTFSDERDKGIVDHGYDDVRYHAASRPAAAIEPPKSHPSGTLAEVMAAHRAAKRERGGDGPKPGDRLRKRWR